MSTKQEPERRNANGELLCKGRAFSGFHYRNCQSRAHASGYCKLHDPQIIEQKRKDKLAKAEARWEARQAYWAEREAEQKRKDAMVKLFPHLVSALRELVLGSDCRTRNAARDVLAEAEKIK